MRYEGRLALGNASFSAPCRRITQDQIPKQAALNFVLGFFQC